VPDSYSVSYITNTMRGAPAITGTAGSLLAVLDALLINGWGLAPAATLEVVGGIATATFGSATSWEVGAVIEISGATPGAINGRARVLTSSTYTMTFATGAGDGSYSGAVGIKYAPAASWDKPFSATNIACYRSTHPRSAGHVLRIDDTSATTPRVVGYESMTDAHTGDGMFPTAAMISGGGSWRRTLYSGTTAIPYMFAADPLLLLNGMMTLGEQSVPQSVNLRGFGTPIALAPGGDAWGTVLSAAGAGGDSNLAIGTLVGTTADSSNSGFCASPRAATGLGTAIWTKPVPASGTRNTLSGADAHFGAAPSAIDGQIKLSRMMLVEQASGVPRSIIPGVAYVPQSGLINLFKAFDVIDGGGEFAGRRMMAVAPGYYYYRRDGIGFVDITGPWRDL
jgi:hypothetical protein